MDNREWHRSERGGFSWWPFALLFVLFLFFFGGHRLWFFSWPLFLFIPVLVIWGVASWFRSAACDGPYDQSYDQHYEQYNGQRDENLDDMFFDEPQEKQKRGTPGEKPKRDGGSDIYYV